MRASTHALGAKAETLAWTYLQRHGFSLECKNYRCDQGEIDLVVRQQSLLVFVEVKSRNDDDLLSTLEMVSKSKQHRIVQTARHYLYETGQHQRQCRFDVIGITRLCDQNPEIHWIKDAFFAAWN